MQKAVNTSTYEQAAPLVDGLEGSQLVWAVLALSLGVGMSALDTAIANTALPAMAQQLHASPADSVWIVNAYQLAMVATLLPIAALGETIGYKRVYVAGMAIFTAASLGCALAWSLPALIVARLFQGLGAAALMGVNSALIRTVYPARLHGRGFGNNALVVAIGFALGPEPVASVILASRPGSGCSASTSFPASSATSWRARRCPKLAAPATRSTAWPACTTWPPSAWPCWRWAMPPTASACARCCPRS
jgi:DHA2 family multidrug resistance protein-like MFS transporter